MEPQAGGREKRSGLRYHLKDICRVEPAGFAAGLQLARKGGELRTVPVSSACGRQCGRDGEASKWNRVRKLAGTHSG